MQKAGVDQESIGNSGTDFRTDEDARKGDLGATERIGHKFLSLPLHFKMDASIVQRIANTIHDYFYEKDDKFPRQEHGSQ